MGYYCTVPQCTSLAGKTKNVKFHRFPRDETMAVKWNIILKRGKPYTKYSKVCSLHFTQADYNVTTMGQWKTLSKDAVPSQNLPKLNPDGTVMVIRKSRTVKYREVKKEDISDKMEKWSPIGVQTVAGNTNEVLSTPETQESFAYRLQALNAIANNVPPQLSNPTLIQNTKPKKQDAIMQTDPIEDEDSQMTSNFENDKTYTTEMNQQYRVNDFEQIKNFEAPKDYTKGHDDYIPQTSDDYNKEAEKYALEHKSHGDYEKMNYQKGLEYDKIPEIYPTYDEKEFETRQEYVYESAYTDSVETLRNQQHNLQILQEQHRIHENQNFFNENDIKQEIDFPNEEEKFLYEQNKEHIVSEQNTMFEGQRRLMEQIEHQVKQEPEVTAGCDNVMQAQDNTYYNTSGQNTVNESCYSQTSRPGPELLIAKQNALAAHTQLWQNTMKRPFFYSESPRYNTPQLLHRYEDLSRILQ